MSPVPDRRDGRVLRRVVSRARILDAALSLFASQGYIGTTLDQIAEHAGVSKGTIFYNFEGKQQIYDNLLAAAVDEIADVLVDPDTSVDDPAGTLSRMVYNAMLAMDLRPDPARLVLQATLQFGNHPAQARAQIEQRIIEPLAGLIGAVLARRPDAPVLASSDLRTVASAVLSGALTLVIDRRLSGHQGTVTESHTALVLALSGLTPIA